MGYLDMHCDTLLGKPDGSRLETDEGNRIFRTVLCDVPDAGG